MSKAVPSSGRARTRTLGWGDRSVVFACVDHQVDGVTARGEPYRTTVPRWEASRGDLRVAVQPADVFSWMVIMDGDAGTTVARQGSLDDALHAAREWLLVGEA